MTPTSVVLYTVRFGLGYLVAPSMRVWGWTRWVKQRPRLWTITATLSCIGFLLSTASALFALWVIWYGAAGGFISSHANYSPNYGLFYQFIRWSIVLSRLGISPLAGCGGEVQCGGLLL